MKRFLTIDEIWPHETYSDDQLSGARFAQGFPNVVTLDSDREFFFSTWRETEGMTVNFNALLKFESNLLLEDQYIGLMHCNGRSLEACDASEYK